jgi:hypothetical protein
MNNARIALQRMASTGHAPTPTLSEKPLQLARNSLETSQRLVSTQLLLTRWALEVGDKQSLNDNRSVQAFTALSSAVKEPFVSSLFSLHESNLVHKELGCWDQSDLYQTEIKWESCGMLCWALRIFDTVPGYDDVFSREKMYKVFSPN